jgi:hypothetical protein
MNFTKNNNMNFTLLEQYDDVEIQVKTNNPQRKYKKKLRKFKAQYEKNPSHELSLKIIEVEKILNNLNKPRIIIKKKVKMKIKKVDKSLKYVNRNTMMSNKKIEKKIKKKQLEDDEETKISSWKENKMHSVLLNLKKNQYVIKGLYLKKMAKTCGFNKHYILDIQLIHSYIENPDELLYNYLMKKYSLVGLKNIQKTMYTTFNTLPMDIIKLIWKFYYNPLYFKIGVLIDEFKEKMDNVNTIYKLKMNLYK